MFILGWQLRIHQMLKPLFLSLSKDCFDKALRIKIRMKSAQTASILLIHLALSDFRVEIIGISKNLNWDTNIVSYLFIPIWSMHTSISKAVCDSSTSYFTLSKRCSSSVFITCSTNSRIMSRRLKSAGGNFCFKAAVLLMLLSGIVRVLVSILIYLI